VRTLAPTRQNAAGIHLDTTFGRQFADMFVRQRNRADTSARFETSAPVCGRSSFNALLWCCRTVNRIMMWNQSSRCSLNGWRYSCIRRTFSPPSDLAGVYSDEIGQEGNYSFCQSLTAKELYYLRANSVRQFRSKSVFWLSLVAMLIGR
jgi:hypothetical protein